MTVCAQWEQCFAPSDHMNCGMHRVKIAAYVIIQFSDYSTIVSTPKIIRP